MLSNDLFIIFTPWFHVLF